jgi:sterol desaturase/sphingolipid hydroxylase (fatty acid hydroxylase superfamily)
VREFYSNFPSIALLSLPRMGIVVLAATAIFLLDYLIRPRPGMFRPRAWLHDILYYAFYNSILAAAILAVPERRLFLPLLRLLNWQILATLPVLPGFVIFFVAADFVSYWHHRWMHSRFLWAFHSVHHEQRELTAFTSGRKHLVEAATTPILLLALAAVLGSPPQDALWFFVLKYLKDATLHSGLRWSYGPLYWIVVSPLFHSAHHSTEVEVSNSNFGVFFSFWDMIFGTHRYTSFAPERQGVEGLSMPTLWSQFWLPFKMAKQGTETPLTSRELAPTTLNRE